MGIYVATNVSALKGQNYLNVVNRNLDTTYQRLSSGLRINSAKDDAAGLQISDRLTSQINGLTQANRNANDGIVLLQTIESGVDELVNILQRQRTLAVQSANGINTKEDRDALQQEASELKDEFNRIVTTTTYAGKFILAGYADNGSSIYEKYIDSTAKTGGILQLQIGANSGDSIEVQVETLVWEKITEKLGLDTGDSTTSNAGVADQTRVINITTSEAASAAISGLDTMIGYLDQQRSNLGAMQNRLESSINVQSVVATNESDARSRIRDTDFAEESAKLSQQSIIQQAATSMLMQANARPQIGLSLLG